jgi:hypothetical protein
MGEDGSWARTGHGRGRVMGGRCVLGARNVDTLVRGHGRGWGRVFSIRVDSALARRAPPRLRVRSLARTAGRVARPTNRVARPTNRVARPTNRVARPARRGSAGGGAGWSSGSSRARATPARLRLCGSLRRTLRPSPSDSVAPACPGRPASARSIGRPGPADIRGMIRPSRSRPVPLPRPLPPYCGGSAAIVPPLPRRRRRGEGHGGGGGAATGGDLGATAAAVQRRSSGGVGWTRLKASSL